MRAKAPLKKKQPTVRSQSKSASIPADQVVPELEKHILVDGFKLVMDLKKSRGSRFVDLPTGRTLIDL
jgi:L-lysine 6-transaminase